MKLELIQKQLKFNSYRIWQYECLMYSFQEHNKTIKQYPERFGMADVITDDNKRVTASFKKSIKSLAELQKSLKKQAKRIVKLRRRLKIAEQNLYQKGIFEEFRQKQYDNIYLELLYSERD